MSIELTWWKDAENQRTPDDHDEIETIRMKTVDEILVLFHERPKRCTLITIQHTSRRKLRNGTTTDFCKVIWRKGGKLLWKKI